jgi:hypothetical protein
MVSSDYRVYMGSSMMVWSLRWLLLHLCSYKLDSFVTRSSQARSDLFAKGCTQACPGDPEGVSRGVFFVWEPLDLRLNIPMC